jgi:hypothetical protein
VKVEGSADRMPSSTFTVEGVELGDNGVAVVTLGGSSTQISTSPLAFAQVVATLTAPGLARSVRFRLDGQDLPVPRGDASVTEAPVDRRDYAELLVTAGGTAPDEPDEPVGAEGAAEPPASDLRGSGPSGSPAPG